MLEERSMLCDGQGPSLLVAQALLLTVSRHSGLSAQLLHDSLQGPGSLGSQWQELGRGFLSALPASWRGGPVPGRSLEASR